MITKFNFKDRTIKSYAIRKLTPLECFRLMGVRDSVIHIMQSTIADIKKKALRLFGFNYEEKQMLVTDADKNEDGTPNEALLAEIKKRKGKFLRFVRDLYQEPQYFLGYQENGEFVWVDKHQYLELHGEDPERFPASITELLFPAEAEYAGTYTAHYGAEDEWKDKVKTYGQTMVYVEVRFYKEYAEYEVKKKIGADTDMAISASQQYKQAGNSIVVDVLAAIYEQLWYPKPRKPKQQLDMFDTLFADEALPPISQRL